MFRDLATPSIFKAAMSSCAGCAVARHVGDDHLLRGMLPEVIDAQASPGIASISAVLNVPIGCVLLPLPPDPEFIGA